MTMTPMELTHRSGLEERVEAAVNDLAAKEAAVDLAREVRNRLVEEAIDVGGWSQRQAARAFRITQASIVRILGHG